MKGKVGNIFEILSIYPAQSWIQDINVFCIWSDSQEKDVFWWAISLLWQYEYFAILAKNGDALLRLRGNISSYLDYYSKVNENTVISKVKINQLHKELINKLSQLNEILFNKENPEEKLIELYIEKMFEN